MNVKSYTYLHPATGKFSSLDLSLCHPSLLLDFDWTVSEDQHGSDHFHVIIESVNNSTNDHNAKWKQIRYFLRPPFCFEISKPYIFKIKNPKIQKLIEKHHDYRKLRKFCSVGSPTMLA